MVPQDDVDELIDGIAGVTLTAFEPACEVCAAWRPCDPVRNRAGRVPGARRGQRLPADGRQVRRAAARLTTGVTCPTSDQKAMRSSILLQI